MADCVFDVRFVTFSAVLARTGHKTLDMDQPLCNMGILGFLRVFQLLLGRNNMVRKQQHNSVFADDST